MAGQVNKKRRTDGRLQRPTKKQRRSQAYNSESEGEEAAPAETEETPDFDAFNLIDSDDDDIHNARVDDVGGSDAEATSSDEEGPALKKSAKKSTKKTKAKAQPEEEESEEGSEEEDSEEGSGDSDDEFDEDGPSRKKKSKRNDPNAFATSLSKILNTKLATSKRSDPVLARSAAAHEASKAAVDTALEAKARKQLKEHKKRAMEKGRVKDVLVATAVDTAGELETTTSEIMVTERRLRKVAQRGVVKLFNAVRAAQVKAVETEQTTRKSGVIGMNRREEKVNEMSKKGFLDLIASGGGGLKKGGLEEA
ncbi:hypothetical protein G7Z17_g5448 [Cylindrodendrum hubeiense]|uniref:RRP15-like protein n=1 Tax=Cylindrodendrum hubeiense TaxID=595255 RepID=A0A9P5HBW4_9HYPO|nr:hypothetical protein G7Z17_g5448 [Cylindrodendrum hubeiense]